MFFTVNLSSSFFKYNTVTLSFIVLVYERVLYVISPTHNWPSLPSRFAIPLVGGREVGSTLWRNGESTVRVLYLRSVQFQRRVTELFLSKVRSSTNIANGYDRVSGRFPTFDKCTVAATSDGCRPGIGTLRVVKYTFCSTGMNEY